MFGVLIIVAGIAWSTYLHLRRPMPGEDTEIYKIRIGRLLLLGLRRSMAMAARAIAHVFESSDRRNGRYTLTNAQELRSHRHHSCRESVDWSG
jgi:hypothetical protein